MNDSSVTPSSPHSLGTTEQIGLLDQTEEAGLMAMPAWIHFGAVGLLVLVLSITGLIYFSHSDMDQVPNLVEMENRELELNRDAVNNPNRPVRPTLTESASLLATLGERDRLPTGDKRIDAHNSGFILESSLTEQMDKLRNELGEQLSQQTDTDRQQDTAITDLQQQVQAQVLKIQQLEQQGSELSKRITKSRQYASANSARSASALRRKVISKPVPFELVSIDRWGDDNYAVLRYQGQLYEKTVGQRLAGWQIQVIDRNNKSIRVQDASGRHHKLHSQSKVSWSSVDD